MIYLTSDTHGLFVRIESFCEKMNTTRDDLLIILGDAGINFSDGWRVICFVIPQHREWGKGIGKRPGANLRSAGALLLSGFTVGLRLG